MIYNVEVLSWRREVHSLYAEVRVASIPEAAHAAWVSGRCDLFLNHPASPRVGNQRMVHADYDPAYRFTLPLLPGKAEGWKFTTGTDGVVPFAPLGRFTTPDWSLEAWWLASYGGGLFLPVRDASAGTLTYGAGRYLLDTVKGADLGRVGGDWVIDFNFAYNPSCVYNERWACPLAPADNRVTIELPVGELLPEGYAN